MTRTYRLVRATRLEIEAHGYDQGLQSMWEARWASRGARGEVQWLWCHGALPGNGCPLVDSPGEATPRSEAPPRPTALNLLRGVRGLTPRLHPLGLHRRKD
jgi:hypothetical protein